MSKRNILKNAVIKNARVCDESENLGHNTVFDIERDYKGWDFVENGTLHGISGGFTFFSATTTSPSLSRSSNFSLVSADTYTEIVIKAKYKNSSEHFEVDSGRVYFKTSSDVVFSEDKSESFEVISDDKWHVYRINMGPVRTWIGDIVSLKVVFADNQGIKGDEIFVEHIKIQNPVFQFCTQVCFEDLSETLFADSFDNQDVNLAPQNWSLTDVNFDNRQVVVRKDPESISNQVLSLENILGSSEGPGAVRVASRQIADGYLSLSFRPTNFSGMITLYSDTLATSEIIQIKLDSNGKLKYKSGLVTFSEFSGNSNYNLNSWNSLLIQFNYSSSVFNTTLNNEQIGNSIPNLRLETIRSLKLENTETTVNNLYFDNLQLVEEFDQSKNCPGVGKQGEVRGGSVDFNRVDITYGMNDTLLVNMNNYGDVIIKIPDRQGYTNRELARELEKQLSSLDVGGYPYCEVDFIDDYNAYRIKSGTYGFDSNVVVSKHLDSTLSDTLGFTEEGISAGISSAGRPHSQGFNFSNTFRPRTYDLNRLIDNNKEDVKVLYHNPTLNTVQIGIDDAGFTGRLNKISGTNKTLIDFLHRATDEGFLEEVFFHGKLPKVAEVKVTTSYASITSSWINLGVGSIKEANVNIGDLVIIDTPGYIGNGTYGVVQVHKYNGAVSIDTVLPTASALELTIESIAKLKHFRPNIDGDLTLINETQLGIEQSGETYTRNHDTYRVDVNWYVHRGDFIGIYNAIEVYAGNDINNSVDAIYLEEDGDLIGDNINVSTPIGAGIRGIGLFGGSKLKQTRAVYDIEFPQSENIEFFEVVGEVLPHDREYNIATAVGKGFNLQVLVSGTHIHRVFNTISALPEDKIHDNIAYNVFTLTDGLRFASNGSVGTFEGDDSRAAYCYISGDGEWTPTYPEDPIDIEFPTAGTLIHERIYDYYGDPYEIRMTWDVPKNIQQFNLFFKEYPHTENYSLEWLKDSSTTYDSEIKGFERIGLGNSSEYEQVYLDRLRLHRDDLDQLVEFQKHFDTTFDAQLSAFNPSSGEVVDTYNKNPYILLQKKFDSVNTTAVRWACRAHVSTKMSEVELISKTDSASGLDESLEFYFSIDGVEFQRVDPKLISENKARFNIGFPTRYLRIVSSPGTTFAISEFYAESSDDTVRYKDYQTKKPLELIAPEIEKGEESAAEVVEVVNRACESSSVELYIETEEIADDLILKSSMNTEEDVRLPEIGPAGVIEQNEDFDLRITETIAINSPCYGLKNLASKKLYYESSRFENESDYFIRGVSYGSRWLAGYHENFPQTAPDTGVLIPGGKINYGDDPGFSIQGVDGDTLANPNPPLNAELHSSWNVVGSFTASVLAETDVRGLCCNKRGATIGIVDGNGRKIYIRKRIRNYDRNAISLGPIQRIYYEVRDSNIGTLSSVQVADILTVGDGSYGQWDDGVEYSMYLTREVKSGVDSLHFYYIDSVNGTNEFQWGTDPVFSIDLLSYNLTDPLKVFIGNYWETQTGNVRPYRYAAGVTPYQSINSFQFAGESTFSSYNISFKFPKMIGSLGEVEEDNKVDLVTDYGAKAIAVDLGTVYNLDIMQIYTNTGKDLWKAYRTQYSSSDTSDIASVLWGNSTVLNARWVLFLEDAVPVTETNVTYLDILRIYPDITRLPDSKFTNSEWESLGNILTDGDTQTAVSQLDYPVIAVDLLETFSVAFYELLDTSNQEYSGRPGFNGWTAEAKQTSSATNKDNPKEVSWDSWVDYSEEDKFSGDIRWLSFKNETFDITDGTNLQKLAATFQASTDGVFLNNASEYKSIVDFTEYASWFTVPYLEENNIAKLTAFEVNNAEDFLYGSASVRVSDNMETSRTDQLFDEDLTTNVIMQASSYNAWRAFGNLFVTSSGVSYSISGIDFPPIETSDIEDTYIEFYEVTANGFGIRIPDSAVGKPNTLTFQTLSGEDPTIESNWYTIYTESDLVEEVYTEGELEDDDNLELVFNGGDTYRANFTSPVTLSGFRVLFEDITYGSTVHESTVTVGDVYLYEDTNKPAAVIDVDNDPNVRDGGRRSLKITYLSGNEESETVTIGTAARIDIDENWSIQDFLSVSLKIDSPELLDLDNCFIRVGQDSTYYYEWSLASIEGDIASTELERYNFRFKDAPIQGIPGINLNSVDRSDLESRVDFKNGPLGFVELELKPLDTTSVDINVWLDNFKIVRENFSLPGKYNDTLYLNNLEYLYYPLSGFRIDKGFFEAWITPDWDFQANTTVTKSEAFTVFTAVNELDESLTCTYSAFSGFTLTITTKTNRISLVTGRVFDIEKYKPFKFSIAWDSSGKEIDQIAGSTVRIWFNDISIMHFTTTWDIEITKNSYFFIGGKAPEIDIAMNITDEYLSSVPGKIVPDLKSVTAGIENVIISREPKKFEFSQLQTLKDKIKISIDGVNFYEGTSNNLPILIENVPPGDSLRVWIKTDLPKDTRNLARKAHLRTRWRRG